MMRYLALETLHGLGQTCMEKNEGKRAETMLAQGVGSAARPPPGIRPQCGNEVRLAFNVVAVGPHRQPVASR